MDQQKAVASTKKKKVENTTTKSWWQAEWIPNFYAAIVFNFVPRFWQQDPPGNIYPPDTKTVELQLQKINKCIWETENLDRYVDVESTVVEPDLSPLL